MKFSKLIFAFVVGSATSAVAFAQQTSSETPATTSTTTTTTASDITATPAVTAPPSTTAAPAAPSVEAAPDLATKASSDWRVDLSYDYYKFDEDWGGIVYVKDYFLSSDVWTGASTRSGALNGGTLSISKGSWALDLSYRTGNSTINSYVQQNYLGVVSNFYCPISFNDKTYDSELRYNFKTASNNWGYYVAIGAFAQSTVQTFSYFQTDNVANPGSGTIAALSGTTVEEYGSLSIGLAYQHSLGQKTFFSLRGQASGLYGQVSDAQAEGTNAAGVLTGPSGLQPKQTATGYKLAGEARLSYVFTPGFSAALEGGVEYWSLKGGGVTNSTTGIIGRAVLRFTF